MLNHFNPSSNAPHAVADKNTKEKMIYIKSDNIIEWMHEFNPDNTMKPTFWVRSEKVCWYQIMSVHKSYEPYFEPLSNVCAYLNAISQAVFKHKAKEDIEELAPSVKKPRYPPITDRVTISRDSFNH
ncbi:hypothetical protein B0O80DRAFT_433535 [Mortierella sp. GBAus27b]|nr:hypothetical protein B0O80DRAFT_433535 [Mortierella sp. GBAus27b]